MLIAQTADEPSDKSAIEKTSLIPLLSNYRSGVGRVWREPHASDIIIDDDVPTDVLSAGSLICTSRTYIREKITRKMSTWHDY